MKKTLKILFPVMILSLILLTSCIPPAILQSRVMIDDLHGNNGYSLSALKTYLEGQGYIVRYSSEDFGFYPVSYGAVIIPNPTAFNQTDLDRLEDFYKQSGGGILFLANRYQSYTTLNSILSTTLGSDLVFGAKVSVASQVGINAAGGYFANHPTTAGVTDVNFVSGCSISLPDGSDAVEVIAVPVNTFTVPVPPAPGFEPEIANPTLYLAGAADSHWLGGKIFAFGSIDTFANTHFNDSDNEILLSNIINWLK